MQRIFHHTRFVFAFFFFCVPFAAGQELSFAVTFDDVVNGTGVGFDDPVSGAERRSAFLSAASDVAGYVNHPGSSVSLQVLDSQTGGTGAPVVGNSCHAISQFTTNGGFFEPFSLLQAESPSYDSSMVCPEGGTMSVQFDFGDTFDLDSSDGVVGWDFDTVAKHGIVRGMGYGSDGVVAGSDTPYGRSSHDAVRFRSFDAMSQFLFFDVDGTEPVWGLIGQYLGDENTPLSDGDVFFHDGPFFNVFPLALGGTDQFLFSGVGSDLMSPLQRGVATQTLSANDIAVLAAVGWDISITAVPEPGSQGMVLIGLLFAAGITRRRR